MAERALVMAARDGFLGSVGPSGCHGRALAIVRSNTAAHARFGHPKQSALIGSGPADTGRPRGVICLSTKKGRFAHSAAPREPLDLFW